jgi:hypothetical protein
MFTWIKRGLIFAPDGNYPWMHSHAQCPFSLDFGDFVRLYFATREKYENDMCRAYGGFVDLDKNDLKKITRISSRPLVDLGGLGEFDEFGSMPISVVRHGGEYYLYYVGWTRGFSVPYDWEIGLARSRDGERFERAGHGPLLGPTLHEPYLNSHPVVYKLADDDWHMFYHTGLRWLRGRDKPESQYIIKHATSTDGLNWCRNTVQVIPSKVENECQVSPTIMRLDGKFHMFFSYRYGLDFRHERDRAYRIGYASSDDLINWAREDTKAGIDVSETGWDSEMIEYPHISLINGIHVMFYCGNQFGKAGIGFAELQR